MDEALALRMAVDLHDNISEQQAVDGLSQSILVKKLTSEFVPKPIWVVWRLLALAEIPFSNRLEYTRSLADWSLKQIATPVGFSVFGKADELLPCYNAMLVYALSRLGYANTPEVKLAVEWIVQYQPFNKEFHSTWKGKSIHKYGGCFKETPCYIGLGKSVKALQAFRAASQDSSDIITEKINQGVEYILAHQLFKRMRQDGPITTHILDIAFPESYNFNILELLQIVELEGMLADECCNAAFAYLESKRVKSSGGWKESFRYKGDGYQTFDLSGQSADWVTYLIGRFFRVRVGGQSTK